MRFLTVLLFAIPLFCQTETKEKSCVIAIVEWRDAVLTTRGVDVESAQTAKVISFGCVFVNPTDVKVILSMTRGEPDIFLTIPKDWLVKITPSKLRRRKRKKRKAQDELPKAPEVSR